MTAVTAPAGAEVGLYVDLRDRVHVGDVIETGTGRRYVAIAVREQRRGKHRGRQHLRAIVLAPGEPVPMFAQQNGDGIDIWAPVVHRIRWYARGRR